MCLHLMPQTHNTQYTMTTHGPAISYREIPTCKNCKWVKTPRYFFRRYWKHAMCTRPSLPKVYDFVEGNHFTTVVWCDIERNPKYDILDDDRCGSSGRHFQPKF